MPLSQFVLIFLSCILLSPYDLFFFASQFPQISTTPNFVWPVFPNIPREPGLPCIGEDKNMYRRGARRWRKLYRINGHSFQAKRFSRVCLFD